MAIEWKLNYKHPQRGMLTLRGVEDKGILRFYDETDETTILEIAVERAHLIASWGFRTQYERINATLQKTIVHLASDHRGSEMLPYTECDYCDGTITHIDDDFNFHSLPWCKQYRRDHDAKKT